MANKTPVDVTEAQHDAHEADINARTRRYLVSMGIRMVCFVLAVIVPGWWKLVFLVGAVFLPWIAVSFANSMKKREDSGESAIIDGPLRAGLTAGDSAEAPRTPHTPTGPGPSPAADTPDGPAHGTADDAGDAECTGGDHAEGGDAEGTDAPLVVEADDVTWKRKDRPEEDA